MATPKQQQMLEQQQSPMQRVKNSGVMMMMSESPVNDEKEEEMAESALALFRAKEEEIERKKMEVRDRVQAYMGRVEEATRRLADIREELDDLVDPMRKDVAILRKRIDTINREMKPLGQTCQKKEKEYKEALEAFNDKNKEKAQLVSKLMERETEDEETGGTQQKHRNPSLNSADYNTTICFCIPFVWFDLRFTCSFNGNCYDVGK
ncbi:hypothetical protein CXB51_016517 [Gossypium anomalum]|uniref:RAB6-interacting golgin n=2 Tax=Gossypium TaxID=3633 RepID=A0A8J5YMH5_9ROSI|nr:hypothetical protein CXB51_016517 [Gossypium anomalum]